LGSWFATLSKKLPDRSIHQLLWQLKPEIAEKPDANATKLIDEFETMESEVGNFDPRLLPPTRFKVKFLGTESRIATVLTARLVSFYMVYYVPTYEERRN
jgi:hypothetical protein